MGKSGVAGCDASGSSSNEARMDSSRSRCLNAQAVRESNSVQEKVRDGVSGKAGRGFRNQCNSQRAHDGSCYFRAF